MNFNHFKKRIAAVLVWVMTIGCIGLSGIYKADTAAAQSVGVPIAPPVACQEPGVSQTVYVSVYNTGSGQTLCYESSNIQLPGTAGDSLEVRVHTPSFDLEAGYLIEYKLSNEPIGYVNMESRNHKLPENIIIWEEPRYLQIGVRMGRTDDASIYAKPSGTLEYKNYSDENRVLKLNDGDQISPSGYYDLLIESSGYQEWGIELVDSRGEQLDGFWPGTLNYMGRHSFTQVPIPDNGQIYAVYTPPGAQGDSTRIETALIGYLPDSHQVIKVVLDPDRERYEDSLDGIVRMDGSLAQLALLENNLYLLENEMASPRVRKEILLDVTRPDPNSSTPEGSKHILTVLYEASPEPNPYSNSHYIPISPDYWRTVTLVSADPSVPVSSLAGVRVYMEVEDHFPSDYSYTDSQGRATFYNLDSGQVENPYEFKMASRYGDNDYMPAFIQIGPSFFDFETYEDRLRVASIKRPGSTDPDSGFHLKDLVWFAQNFQSADYGYDLNQDGELTKDDLRILMNILAPHERD